MNICNNLSIMSNIELLYYDKIDVSGAIDVNKTSKSKEWDFFTIDIQNTEQKI